MATPEKTVIVGAGHAAGQFVMSLLAKKFAGSITLIGDEPWVPYQRPPLSKKFLAGELDAERLFLKPHDYYADAGVATLLETRVVAIDRRAKHVVTDSSQPIPYDKLVLALGSRPRRLDIPGTNLSGVSTLRSIEDVESIRQSLQTRGRVAIVGAGYIGLEVAAVLRSSGARVTVIEALDRVMSRVVSPEVSAFYERAHTAHGVDLLLSTQIDAFEGERQVSGVRLADGRCVAADTVVVGVGITPNTALAADADLDVDNGIVVNSRCQTSDPDIYALGDCTSHPNPIFERRLRLESVHNALEQAKTAAANIAGQPLEYAQVPWFWSDQYDLKLQIAGLSQGYDECVLRGTSDTGPFSCLYLQKGQLIAIDAINSPRDFMQAKALIANRAVIDPATLADSGLQLKEMSYPAG